MLAGAEVALCAELPRPGCALLAGTEIALYEEHQLVPYASRDACAPRKRTTIHYEPGKSFTFPASGELQPMASPQECIRAAA